jgi:hypothetical protein
MAEPADAWYVRLPDGRVLRAASTAAVRHHLEAHRIPVASRVRRSPEDAWAPLERTREFADLVPTRAYSATPPPPTRRPTSATRSATPRPAAHANGLHLQTVGVRGCVDELLGALDSTLLRSRLLGAAAVGLLSAVILLLVRHYQFGQESWAPLPWVAAGVAILAVYALYAAFVTQVIFVELSLLRPPTRAEAVAGLVRNWLRLAVSWLLVGGVSFGVLAGLTWLEGWVRAADVSGAELMTGSLLSLRLTLEVLLWPALGLALLLGPVVVIEECSPRRALGQWGALLWRALTRLFVYETLAAALGVVLSLPLVSPVALAAWASSGGGPLNPVAEGTLAILCGLALTPLLAYSAVASVHVYLNVRYEHTLALR